MKIRSITTGRVYDPDLMVFIENPTQIAKYLKHGVTLYDLFDNDDNLVAAFSKRETSELYKLWQKHELK